MYEMYGAWRSGPCLEGRLQFYFFCMDVKFGVSHPKGRTYIEDIREQVAVGNIWTEEAWECT
jgi:hypothetical protein